MPPSYLTALIPHGGFRKVGRPRSCCFFLPRRYSAARATQHAETCSRADTFHSIYNCSHAPPTRQFTAVTLLHTQLSHHLDTPQGKTNTVLVVVLLGMAVHEPLGKTKKKRRRNKKNKSLMNIFSRLSEVESLVVGGNATRSL